MDLDNAGDSDKIGDTVNYEDVYRICSEIMGFQFELIEKVGKCILDEIENLIVKKLTEQELDGGVEVTVRVRKMNPPLDGPVDSTFVEMVRRVR